MHVLEATVGGTRRHLLDLCRGLPRDRFDLHVVCSLERNPGFAEDLAPLQGAGLEVSFLSLSREIHPLRDWRGLQQLRRLVRQWRPDIVHGHSAKGGFLARLAASLTPGPATVYNPHAFPFQMQVSASRRKLYLALERWAGRRTDRLIAVSTGERDLAVQYGLVPSERIALIPNGLRVEAYADCSAREAVRAEWGVPADAILCGVVAALTAQKNVASLLRAAARVRQHAPRAQFVVIGEGPEREALEHLAGELGLGAACRFTGQRVDVPRLLPALEIFVLPSLWEGLPYALLEAGAAGLPVVATDIPGNRDLVREGETGWLAPPGDVEALAQRLGEAVDDHDRARRGEGLRSLVRREYTLERMIAQHVALYEELRGRRPQPGL